MVPLRIHPSFSFIKLLLEYMVIQKFYNQWVKNKYLIEAEKEKHANKLLKNHQESWCRSQQYFSLIPEQWLGHQKVSSTEAFFRGDLRCPKNLWYHSCHQNCNKHRWKNTSTHIITFDKLKSPSNIKNSMLECFSWAIYIQSTGLFQAPKVQTPRLQVPKEGQMSEM